MGVHDSVVKIIDTSAGAGATIGTPSDAVAHGTTNGTVISKLKSVADYSQTLGTPSEAAASVGGTGSLSAKLRLGTTLWDAIKTAVEAISTATGATGDAAASAGGTGSLSAKLRNVTSLLSDIKAIVQGTLVVSGTVTVNEPVSIDDNGGSLTVDGTVAVTNSDIGATATVLGATGDAAATVGSTGTISAKARLITTLLDAIKTATEGANTKLGGTLTVGGTVAVTNSDVTASATVLGATGDAAATAGSTGTLSAKTRFLTSITNTMSSTLTSILGGVGAPGDALSGGTTDGTVIAKLKGLIESVGTLADTAGLSVGSSVAGRISYVGTSIGPQDDTEATGDGSLIAITKRLRTLLGTINTSVGATTTAVGDVETLVGALFETQEDSWWANDSANYPATYPVLRTSTNLALTAGTSALGTAGMGHTGWSATTKYIFIPVTHIRRIAFSLLNAFNQDITLEVYGTIYANDALGSGSTTNQSNVLLLTAIPITAGSTIWVTGEAPATGVGAGYHQAPLNAGWTHITLKITPAGDPTSGQLALLLTRNL